MRSGNRGYLNRSELAKQLSFWTSLGDSGVLKAAELELFWG
jgi:hypothetical protein